MFLVTAVPGLSVDRTLLGWIGVLLTVSSFESMVLYAFWMFLIFIVLLPRAVVNVCIVLAFVFWSWYVSSTD